ncbi:DUF1302 domain-containing protein [Arenibaculum pallidiluteum]|uniref:DUF1302 domain-containing protein n=1 Tax=Arenibaculum pallidiluteum TaxID=2812559 RepID=UPI001A97427B|nr:DUF1302 domain-containing protein [Arenibaculum pallidiluteum]
MPECLAKARGHRAAWLCGVSALALAVPLLTPTGTRAVEFRVGQVTGSFDTTLSLGALFRTQDPDQDLIGAGNGGRGYSINVDDGNRNYDKGLASLAGKATHELTLGYEDYGAFVRGTYFYDWVNAPRSSSRGARTGAVPFSAEAQEAVGRDFELLDAYVFGSWDVADRPLTLRLGNQVLNWGESTFIPSGLSNMSPFDVAALRVPGSEIRDALKPVPMISASLGVTDAVTVEGFYQFTWEETRLEPRGTLFSTNDFAVDGGRNVFLGFGNPLVTENTAGPVLANLQNQVVNPILGPLPRPGVGAPIAPFGARVPRGLDEEPRDGGQFGFAARYFAEELNETEFGFYFVNTHSRVPVISAQTGFFGPGATGPLQYAANSRYRVEYPEDIKVLATSFNTNLGGITLQGEYSLRKDQPLQLDDVELLQASLAPAAVAANCAGAATAAQVATCGGTVGVFNSNQILRDQGTAFSLNPALAASQAAGLFNREIQGYRLHDVSQFQLGASKVFPPALGADQWLLVGEVGGLYVHDMPEKGTLRYDGPGTFRGGNPNFLGVGGMPSVQTDGFADAFSWGYRLRARLDYLNALGSVNLYPILSWQHDVEGTTPLPLGTFLEDRKAISIGLQATYLDTWAAEIQWTAYFGGENFNLLHDRDFISAVLRYSF